jgi:hypothetical protein
MEQVPIQHIAHPYEEPDASAGSPENKQPWEDPKLVFVEPKLTHHGAVQEVTGQSFRTFVP